MLMKGQQEEIIQRLHQGVVAGWKGSIEHNNSTCRKGMKLGLILMNGLHKGSILRHTSLNNLIAMTENESWKIYESK